MVAQLTQIPLDLIPFLLLLLLHRRSFKTQFKEAVTVRSPDEQMILMIPDSSSIATSELMTERYVGTETDVVETNYDFVTEQISSHKNSFNQNCILTEALQQYGMLSHRACCLPQ